VTDTPGLNDLLASSPAGEQRLQMISNSVPLGRVPAAGDYVIVNAQLSEAATSPVRSGMAA